MLLVNPTESPTPYSYITQPGMQIVPIVGRRCYLWYLWRHDHDDECIALVDKKTDNMCGWVRMDDSSAESRLALGEAGKNGFDIEFEIDCVVGYGQTNALGERPFYEGRGKWYILRAYLPSC